MSNLTRMASDIYQYVFRHANYKAITTVTAENTFQVTDAAGYIYQVKIEQIGRLQYNLDNSDLERYDNENINNGATKC